MAQANGTALSNTSYLDVAKQAVFGTAVSSGFKTLAFSKTGSPFVNRKEYGIRDSTGLVMPKAAHVFEKVALVDVAASFWYIGDDTLLLDLLTCAWGRRDKTGAGPFTHTYQVVNPHNTDVADAGATFLNHGLTMRLTETDGSGSHQAIYKVQDVNITRLELSQEANGPLICSFRGTGQKETDDSAAAITSFADFTGSVFAYNHLAAGANGGLYFGSANPPTTALRTSKITFALEHNLNFDIDLGAAVGSELARPTRGGLGYPTATVDVEMYFEKLAAGQDATAIMTDFLASTARNFKAKWYVSANEALELKAYAATAPCRIQNVQYPMSGSGRSGFSFQLLILPATVATDFNLIQTTNT